MTVGERYSSDNETHSGNWNDDTQWNERAAFRINVESREVSEGRLVWRTWAYHEEHDQRRVWTGVPDEALLEWILDQVRQSIGGTVPSPVRRSPAGAASATPPSDAPADNLQQIPGIGPATARRLRTAGITTFAALAACSPSDVATWTGRSAEQIVRMEWIERARELASPTSPPKAPLAAALVAAAPTHDVAAAETSPVEMAAELPTVRAAPPEAPLVAAAPTHDVATAETSPVEMAAELPTVRAAPPETPVSEPLTAEVHPVEETPIAEPAQALAGTSGREATPSATEEIREVQNMMLEEAPIIFAAVLLDEEGDVQDVRLTTTGDQPPEWNDQQVARFFIETATPISYEATPVALRLDNVQIDMVSTQPGTGVTSRLHATAILHLEGAESIGIQHAPCHIFLLAYDLAAGETHILGTARIEVTTGTAEVPLTLDADLPEVGRYQLLLAALIPEALALSAVSGPRLRVTP